MNVASVDLLREGRCVESGFAAMSADERTCVQLESLRTQGNIMTQKRLISEVLSAHDNGTLRAWYRQCIHQMLREV